MVSKLMFTVLGVLLLIALVACSNESSVEEKTVVKTETVAPVSKKETPPVVPEKEEKQDKDDEHDEDDKDQEHD